MKTIYHVSDTHMNHEKLIIPQDIDIMIHSGDMGNYRNPYNCEVEIRNFIEWYSKVNIPHKICIAGNHDTAIEKGLVKKKDFEDAGIIYLENEMVTIEGINIYGSPATPRFGDWAFMYDRGKIYKIWDKIPDTTDILVTHGPGKGTLDLSTNRLGQLEYCGCSNLLKQIRDRIKPKFHLFGHIHDSRETMNSGMCKYNNIPDTTFSNGSVVTDGKIGTLTSNGNIFKI